MRDLLIRQTNQNVNIILMKCTQGPQYIGDEAWRLQLAGVSKWENVIGQNFICRQQEPVKFLRFIIKRHIPNKIWETLVTSNRREMKVQESSEPGRSGSSPSRKLQFGNNDLRNCYFHKAFNRTRKKRHQDLEVKMKETTQTSVLLFEII